MPALLAGTAPHCRRTRGARAPGRSATPADGIIDWTTRAPFLYDWVRAQTRPYPGAFTFLGDEKVVLWRARPPWSSTRQRRSARSWPSDDGGVVVRCGDGALLVEEVEMDGEV